MGNNLPSWFDWFKITLPVCVIIDLLVWVLLLAIYKPGSEESALLVQPPELFHHSRMEPVMPNVLGRYYANGKFVASVSGDVGGCQYSSEEEENALPTTALLRKTTSSRLSSAGSVSSGGDRLSNNNNITTTTRRVNINPRNDEEGDDDDDEENAAGLAPMTSSGLFRRYNNRNDDDDDNGRSSCNPWLGGWTPTQFFILAVCVFTILLWCVEKNIEWLVGDMGVM